LENFRNLHEKPVYSPKVKLWSAINKCGVIGPYFIEVNGITVTINSDRYINMINNFLDTELRRRISEHNMWFQQDGAIAHTARASMETIRALFSNRVISRFGDIRWPPGSPDLLIRDFFLRLYLKSRVYELNTRALEDLKTAIRDKIEEIDLKFPNRWTLTSGRDLYPWKWSSPQRYHLSHIIFLNGM